MNYKRRGRVKRLDQLSRDLSKEVFLWKGGDDPLHLSAIHEAIAGVEPARVVLVRGQQRLVEEGAARE
jgi:hypothetical protein